MFFLAPLVRRHPCLRPIRPRTLASWDDPLDRGEMATGAAGTAATSAPSTTASPPVALARRPRRQRHAFNDLDAIPSFQDFQHQAQVRALYRQYQRTVRAATPVGSGGSRELRDQVRHEFRRSAVGDSSGGGSDAAWERRRLLADGARRLKELTAMLGGSGGGRSGGGPSRPVAVSVPENPWPWQR